MKFFFSGLVIAWILRGSCAENPLKNEESKIRAQHQAQHHDSERNLLLRQWQPKIVGGREADFGEYPFFVQASLCGASLVWDDIVLTAAHCKGGIAFNGNQVLVGAHELNQKVREHVCIDIVKNMSYAQPSQFFKMM